MTDIDPYATLLGEQLRHAITLFKSDLDANKAAQCYYRDLSDTRLKSLETTANDHETRLRSATDGVTQFKTLHTLLTGASGIIAIIALIRSFFP